MSRLRFLHVIGLLLLIAVPLAQGAGAERASPTARDGTPLPQERPALPAGTGEMGSPVPAAGWTIEVIDPARGGGASNRNLALDAAGWPHIVYGHYYTWYDGVAWHTDAIDSQGSGASLALDGAGRPHVSYAGDPDYGLRYAYYDGSDWITTTVDSANRAGLYSSLVLDAAGRPHISYWSWLSYDLRYAYYDGTAWIITTVDSEGMVGQYTSLALDGAGHPHISYYDDTNRDLKYAYYDGTSWHLETVDAGDWVGEYTSLALDSQSRPHIAYLDYGNRDLKYAYYDGAGWYTETVPNGADYGLSLVLDGQDHPHISYYGGGLEYAYYDGTSWSVATVDGAGDVGGYSSLALDAAGQPRISYWTLYGFEPPLLPDDLKYAYLDGSSWHTETVDSLWYKGDYSSLALDAAGRPRVAYCVDTCMMYRFGGACWCDNVKYLYHDGTGWQWAIVESERDYGSSSYGAVGPFTTLALDSAGLPHIGYYVQRPEWVVRYAQSDGMGWLTESVAVVGMEGDFLEQAGGVALVLDGGDNPYLSYFDDRENTARYAWRDGGAWVSGTLSADLGEIGGFNALALDAAGYPHVCYYDSYQGALWYTAYDGAAWHGEMVDSVGPWNRRARVSLALDAAGRPHMSYYDAVEDALKYAWHDGTGWQITTVDQGGVGQFSDLALDRFGRPHISYLDSVQEDLRYAYQNGVSWLITTVDSAGRVGYHTSLALDAQDSPHITYCRWDCLFEDPPFGLACSCRDLKYATLPCQPVAAVAADGPGQLPLNITALYTASYTPISATVPAFSWNNGSIGPTAAYSWSVTGTYTVAVSGTNACSPILQDSMTVTIFCQPVEEAAIAGPSTTVVGWPTAYQVGVQPITASRPLTFTWDNGAGGSVASYTWPATGTYTVTVTATNPCGAVVRSTRMVRVLAEWPYRLLLPLMLHGYTSGLCTPLVAATVTGPDQLLVGESGLYRALYVPPGATPPVTVTWDNGTVGPTAAYSWTVPGLHTLAVTATNACDQAATSHAVSVTVPPPCEPVLTAAITGPVTLPAGATGRYTATYGPPTATLPLTLTWDNRTVGPTAAYSWTVPGLYTLTVTATNPCGEVSAVLAVSVTPAACRPAQTVVITGSRTPCAYTPYLYTATVSPPTATTPLTVTWDNGSVGMTAIYSWTSMGGYTLTVTATNACGQVHGNLHVLVCPNVAERRPASGQRPWTEAFRPLLPFSAISFDMVFTHHGSRITSRFSCKRG